MNKMIRCASVLAVLSLLGVSAQADQSANPYLGRWALTIPGGGAGWLGVTQEDGYLDASILWGGGSVVPVDCVFTMDGTLYVLRLQRVERRNTAREVVRTQMFPDLIEATVDGDALKLKRITVRRNGEGVNEEEFTGKRIPPLPPAPDLTEIEYGDPVVLFDGTSLDGWKLTNENQTNGWSVPEGSRTLVNNPARPEGRRRVSYGNLRTVGEFEDFNLKLEVNVPKGGNSGIYLRGIYEVQISDSYGRPLDSHNMGAIYSRIAPTDNAEKPAGQWQTMDITLVDRHVTVKLNGTTIIDNQPLLGCTGGALSSDEFKPGPIYLQGDHTAVSYRNIVLTPVIK